VRSGSKERKRNALRTIFGLVMKSFTDRPPEAASFSPREGIFNEI
jgi:hypothetical protein